MMGSGVPRRHVLLLSAIALLTTGVPGTETVRIAEAKMRVPQCLQRHLNRAKIAARSESAPEPATASNVSALRDGKPPRAAKLIQTFKQAWYTVKGHLLKLTGKRHVRVALCQIDTTIGDFEGNTRQILNFIRKAGEAKSDIAVFPEMAISSYSPRDLLERPGFVNANDRALQYLLSEIRKIPNAPSTIVIGSIVKNPGEVGRELKNAAIVIKNGKIVHVQGKQLLPNYDIFDDMRYFEPDAKGKPWKSEWGRVGCAICEDAWAAHPVNGRRLYAKDPAQDLRGSDLGIHLAASPYYQGKDAIRKSVLSGFTQRVDAPMISVNQVGAHDDILFDGRSTVFDPHGNPAVELPSFSEAIGIVDMRLGPNASVTRSSIQEWDPSTRQWRTPRANTPNSRPPRPPLRWDGTPWRYTEQEMEELENGLVYAIRAYFKKAGYKRAILPMSGGVDSSITSVLLVKALGKENVIGVSMSSKYSSKGSVDHAKQLADKLGIKLVYSPIKEEVAAVENGLNPTFKTLESEAGLKVAKVDNTEDNIQARLRGIKAMAIANKYEGMVVTTSNKSEMALGQTTIYGDMAGAFTPLGDLYKSDVYELAHHLNRDGEVIPNEVLTKPASAELAPGQSDEAKFGAWKDVDRVLRAYIEDGKTAEAIAESENLDLKYVQDTVKHIKKNEFKRNQAGFAFKVKPKSFGQGRRIPVSQRERRVTEDQ